VSVRTAPAGVFDAQETSREVLLYVSVQEEIQVWKELACEPGSEMVPGRAITYDGLNGQEQKTEDSERRRKRMTRPTRK
jgi:hypothetical protein